MNSRQLHFNNNNNDFQQNIHRMNTIMTSGFGFARQKQKQLFQAVNLIDEYKHENEFLADSFKQ